MLPILKLSAAEMQPLPERRVPTKNCGHRRPSDLIGWTHGKEEISSVGCFFFAPRPPTLRFFLPKGGENPRNPKKNCANASRMWSIQENVAIFYLVFSAAEYIWTADVLNLSMRRCAGPAIVAVPRHAPRKTTIIWVFSKIGVEIPQNGWFISWKTLLKMGWFGGKTHYFRKRPFGDFWSRAAFDFASCGRVCFFAKESAVFFERAKKEQKFQKQTRKYLAHTDPWCYQYIDF